MRSLLIISSAILFTACAGQQTMPEKAAPAPAPVAAPAAKAPAPAVAAAPAPAPKKVPQCYSGDEDKFFSVGDKAKVAGLDVVCGANSDGTVGQWTTGAGHHKK